MPTDAQIEAAAHVLHEEFCMTRVYEGQGDDERVVGITPWDWLGDESRERYRTAARAALEAVETLQETEWEYAWEADEEKRARMNPRGPRLMIDGYFAPPEQIAEFPKGRRVRRRKAGPWIALEGETP